MSFWNSYKGLQRMTDAELMKWIDAGRLQGPAWLRAYAAARWCRIKWPDDDPNKHRSEAAALFDADDAQEKKT